MNYKVCGMREEIYIGKEVSGHNCDFDYTDAEMTRHVLLLKDDDGNKVELTLQEDQGECGSGWCTATYGEYGWNEVVEFAGKTHTYSGGDIELTERSIWDTEYGIKNEAFYFSSYGGCRYYPSGGYSVAFDKFTPI